MASPRQTTTVVGALVLLAACGGTPGLPGIGGDSTAAFCKTARGLPAVAEEFDADSVDDPATFDAELRSAVDSYLAELDDLASRAPSDLEKDIRLLMSAVDQYKFADAIDAKEPLDIYVAEHCEPPTT